MGSYSEQIYQLAKEMEAEGLDLIEIEELLISAVLDVVLFLSTEDRQ